MNWIDTDYTKISSEYYSDMHNTIYQGKKILILGGKPIASCDIVEYAKKCGAYTIVADYLPSDESPAKQIADEAWDISTSDVERLIEKVKANGIDAVFTGVHEYNIDKTIRICKAADLPFYASVETYSKLSNKAVYKQLLAKDGMPSIKTYYKGYYKDCVLNGIEFPVIVKPVDGNSGVGIKICDNEGSLLPALQLAGETSAIGHIIVEEYVDASEVTIFYVAQNGKIRLSAMADRKTKLFHQGIIPLPYMYDFPSVHLAAYERLFNDKVVSMLSKAGVKDGMVFMQAFWRNEKVYIYDIGYRLTGTQEYNLLSELCGYNPMEMMVDYSLTGKMGKDDISERVDPFLGGKYAGIVTCLMMPGTISKFVGSEEIKKIPGVIKFLPNHEIGETVAEDRLGTLSQIAARAFIVVEDKQQLDEIKNKVVEKFNVISDEGRNLSIK